MNRRVEEVDAWAQQLVGHLLARLESPLCNAAPDLPGQLYAQIREVLREEGVEEGRQPSIEALAMATFATLLAHDSDPSAELLPSIHRAWEYALEEVEPPKPYRGAQLFRVPRSSERATEFVDESPNEDKENPS